MGESAGEGAPQPRPEGERRTATQATLEFLGSKDVLAPLFITSTTVNGFMTGLNLDGADYPTNPVGTGIMSVASAVLAWGQSRR